MKMSSIFHVFIIWLVTSSLFINTLAMAASEKYEAKLKKYAKQTKVISGGRYGGSRVSIRVGGYAFYENVPDTMGPIGLYVVAIYKDEVLLKYHYNTR